MAEKYARLTNTLEYLSLIFNSRARRIHGITKYLSSKRGVRTRVMDEQASQHKIKDCDLCLLNNEFESRCS
jgi:hypothetical protein